MIQKNINRDIVVTTTILIATIVFFQFSDADIYIEDFFYNFQTKNWILDRENQVIKFIFYDGAKRAIIIFASVALLSLIFLRNNRFVKEYRAGLVMLVLSAIFVPLIAIGLKNISNTPCPKNIVHYDGNYPNIKVFDTYPKEFKQECKIKCWPAGHASAGFALLALFTFFKTPRNQKKAIVVALIIGWSMGMYKMLVGDHYFSHTLITMVLAWLIILIIYKGHLKILQRRVQVEYNKNN